MAIKSIVEYEGGDISISSDGCKEVWDKFKPNFYHATYDSNGNMIIKTEKLEELHEIYATEQSKILVKTIDGFFKKGVLKKVNNLGFIHKLGVLLHGIQGGGKTSIIHALSQYMINKYNAVAFFVDDSRSLGAATSLVSEIRKIQDNPIVIIFDEFEKIASREESMIKNLLDGNHSINNFLFFATTNYLDQIPKTISERPSRFKIVQEVKGFEDKKIMKDLIKNISVKIKPGLFTNEEIDKLLLDVTSLTLDQIKHLCLDKITNTYVPKAVRCSIGFRGAPDVREEIKEDSEEQHSFIVLNSSF